MSQRSDRAPRPEPTVPDTGHGPGVLVLAPGAGCGDLARDACARLARHGFVAWAPALSAESGPGTSDRERSAIDAAIERMFCEHATDGARVGVIGFGPGGRLAFDAAGRTSRVGVVIALDGDLGPAALVPPAVANVQVAVLAVFGEKDPVVERGDAAVLEQCLRAEGIPCEVRILPGVETGFLDPARPDRYDASAARACWDAALARLRAEL